MPGSEAEVAHPALVPAQVVSQLGDWFNAVAVYALLLDLTGSATLVAAMMVVQLLPLALVGPLAGVVVDRMSRRTLMIGADLARAVLFAGLVFVRSADQIWLAFLLVTLGVIATAFFEPARTAMLPDVVPRESLITANALSAATWAVMLAVGASVGGAMTVLVGRDAAFIGNGPDALDAEQRERSRVLSQVVDAVAHAQARAVAVMRVV